MRWVLLAVALITSSSSFGLIQPGYGAFPMYWLQGCNRLTEKQLYPEAKTLALSKYYSQKSSFTTLT
jgi:hypothetical protein